MFQSLDGEKAIEVFKAVIIKHCDIWVYEADSVICGFIAMKGSYIDRLYVDPTAQNTGVGTSLLLHAKKLCPQRLDLSTHQENHRAREFYEKSGFVVVKYGISPPPESVPDVQYRWTAKTDT